MKKHLILGVLGLICSVSAFAQQQKSIRIKASDLQQESTTLAGHEDFWPIVSSLAIYHPESNSFEISGEHQLWLATFKEKTTLVLNQRNLFAELIKNGAKVFAANELETYEKSYASFQKAVREGKTEQALAEAELLQKHIITLKNATETNRKEAVSAILADKTGDVFKRKGIISSWNSSDKGDLYAEQDGIKTAQKSYAKLDFTDGSFVMINPETIATIRLSKIDKLSNTSETEIQISDGGLLASLSAKSRQQTDFVVKAADSETRVNSTKFYAEKGTNDRVTYSNYEGSALVRVASAEVELNKNEGTVVERGKEPLPPVKLLEFPRLTWPNSDSLTYDPIVFLTWTEVEKASYYEIEVSPTPAFTYGIERYTSKTTSLKLENITDGTRYIRLRAYDKLGLRGTDSPNYRLLKNKDTQAPAIFFKNGLSNEYFTRDDQFTLEGITEPGSQLRINNKPVEIKRSGEFRLSIPLPEKNTSLEIEASDRSNNKTQVTKRIIKMEDEQLWALNWSVPVSGNSVRRAPVIQVSGKAYEPLLVEASVGSKVFKVECGQTWDWALQLQALNADFIQLRFILKKTGEVIAEKQFLLN